jgi:hypothetical protein
VDRALKMHTPVEILESCLDLAHRRYGDLLG